MEEFTLSKKFSERISISGGIGEDLKEEFGFQNVIVAAENNQLTINPKKFNSLGLFLEIINKFQDKKISKDKYIKIDYNADYGLLVSDKALMSRVVILHGYKCSRGFTTQ